MALGHGRSGGYKKCDGSDVLAGAALNLEGARQDTGEVSRSKKAS